MSKIDETPEWVPEIYRLTTEAAVLGFDAEDNSDGPSNVQAEQLAKRTQFLKSTIESIIDYREFTFQITEDDPDGTIAGLAATSNGQLFRVIIKSASNVTVAFKYYVNRSGVADFITSLPNEEFLRKTYDLAKSIDRRTGGLFTQSDSDFPLEIIDILGRLAACIDDSANLVAFGKLISDVVRSNVQAEIQGSVIAGESNLPFEFVDKKGRSPFYFDELARVIFSGGIKGNPQTRVLELLDTVVALALKVNGELRIGGVTITDESNFPLEIVDLAGKAALFVEDDALVNLPGGLASGDIETGASSALRNGDFFVIGDSIFANGVAHSGGGASGTSYAPTVRASFAPAWASLKSNGRLKIAGISATPGYTVSQIASIHLPNAIAAKASFCIVVGGRNDIIQGVSIDNVTIPIFESIFTTLLKFGIIPVICTSPAQNNDANDIWRAKQHQLNGWLRAYAKAHQLPFVDFHTYTTDQTGNWLTGDFSKDGVHPEPAGANIMGTAIYDGMIDWVLPAYPQQAVEQLAVDGLTNNKLPNPLFLISDGNAPSEWTLSEGATSSLSTDSDVRGNVWMLTGQASITIPVIAGAKMGLGFFVKTGSGKFEFYAVAGDTSSTVHLAGIRDWWYGMSDFRSFYYEFIVPVGITQVTLFYRASSPASRIAQAALFEVKEV